MIKYILKHWRGELSLAISFWVNYFLIQNATSFLLNWFAQSSPIDHPVISARVIILIVIIYLFIYIWQIVGLWRACNRHVAVYCKAFWARTVQTIVVLGLIASLGNIALYGGIYKEVYQFGFQKDTTPAYSLTLRKDDSLIHLEGGLKFGVSKDVAALLKDHPDVKGIILDCDGGWIYEGRKLSKLILVYGLDTYTLEGCYSAGTIAFISGTNRFLGTGANLGFHQYSMDYENLRELADMEKEQEEDLRIFKRKGIKKEFLEKLYGASAEDFWYPSIDELLSAGVIHGVVNTSDLTPIEYGEGIKDINVKEILLDIPVYRTLQKYESEVFEQIITGMNEQFKKGATFLEIQETGANRIWMLASRLLSMSSDETLIRFGQILVDMSRKLVEIDPFLCLKFVYPEQYGTFTYSEYFSHDEFESLNEVLRNIIIDAHEKENPQIDIEAAELQLQEIITELGDDVEYVYIDLKKLQNSDQYKRHSDALIRTYELILAKDKRFAANMLRYMSGLDDSDGSATDDNASDDGDYDGDIVDGKRHGYGTYTGASGEKYVGEFKNGMRHGPGTNTLPDGEKYVGGWKDDKQHGQGTITWLDGGKFVGKFKDNNVVDGWYYLADGSRKWVYTDAQGNWKYKDEADGKMNGVTRKEEFKHEGLSQKEEKETVQGKVLEKSDKPEEINNLSSDMHFVLQMLGEPSLKEIDQKAERWNYGTSYVEFKEGALFRCYEPHGKGDLHRKLNLK